MVAHKTFEAQRAKEERSADRKDREHPEYAIRAKSPKLTTKAGEDLKLAVIVGHTEIAPGAESGPPINQCEYVWNSELAKMVGQECARRGIICKIFFRDGVGIAGAYRQVDDWQATAAVELHFNCFNCKANGTETLYGDIRGSREFAQRMQEAMLHALELQDRGIQHRSRKERGGQSVNSAHRPSILIEPFFGDNVADATRAKERKPALASAVVEAFAGAFADAGA